MTHLSIFISMVITLIFVIDPFGAIPQYLALVGPSSSKKHLKFAVQELVIALLIMILFHFVGDVLFSLLNLTKPTVEVAGGIVLFIISIRLIFPSGDENQIVWEKNTKPFIVPIATPLIAGPSVLAMVMIYAQEEPRDLIMIAGIFLAWIISSIIILFAYPLYKFLGEKGLMAIERLTGLIVALIAVQKFLEGIRDLLAK